MQIAKLKTASYNFRKGLKHAIAALGVKIFRFFIMDLKIYISDQNRILVIIVIIL